MNAKLDRRLRVEAGRIFLCIYPFELYKMVTAERSTYYLTACFVFMPPDFYTESLVKIHLLPDGGL
jgi:hypothetical protein